MANQAVITPDDITADEFEKLLTRYSTLVKEISNSKDCKFTTYMNFPPQLFLASSYTVIQQRRAKRLSCLSTSTVTQRPQDGLAQEVGGIPCA